jgi:hypothetical protein
VIELVLQLRSMLQLRVQRLILLLQVSVSMQQLRSFVLKSAAERLGVLHPSLYDCQLVSQTCGQMVHGIWFVQLATHFFKGILKCDHLFHAGSYLTLQELLVLQ